METGFEFFAFEAAVSLSQNLISNFSLQPSGLMKIKIVKSCTHRVITVNYKLFKYTFCLFVSGRKHFQVQFRLKPWISKLDCD